MGTCSAHWVQCTLGYDYDYEDDVRWVQYTLHPMHTNHSAKLTPQLPSPLNYTHPLTTHMHPLTTLTPSTTPTPQPGPQTPSPLNYTHRSTTLTP